MVFLGRVRRRDGGMEGEREMSCAFDQELSQAGQGSVWCFIICVHSVFISRRSLMKDRIPLLPVVLFFFF